MIHNKKTVVNKPWGSEIIYEFDAPYVVKEIHIRAGQETSLQYHKEKVETIYIKSGDGWLTLNHRGKLNTDDLVTVPVKAGDVIHIRPKTLHRLKANNYLCTIEVQTPHLDDVVRVEDKYKR